MDVTKVSGADMGIDLRRANTGVAEQLLDDPQIGSVMQQVSGEAVAEHVWGDRTLDSASPDVLFNPQPERHRCKGGPTAGEEDSSG